MRKYSVILLVSLLLSCDENEIEKLRTENRELRAELTELSAESKQSGGAEIVPKRSVETDVVFPVHLDDYRAYTSAYGLRVSPFLGVEMWHTGLDISAVWRAQVVSIADGIVIEHWPSPGTPYPGGGEYKGHNIYGGMVKIDHGDMISVYAHLSSTRIHEGDSVRAGEIIGRIGSTGKADGQHLHFEILIDGESVNPLHYLPEVR